MMAMSSMFAERGFTTMEIDLSYPPQDAQAAQTSEGIMKHFEDGKLAVSLPLIMLVH